MFIFFPIRTSLRPYRIPYANYAIIAINFLVFFLSYAWPDRAHPEVLRPWAEQFMLTPIHPYIWQFITYAFLHGGVMHIAGNMLFLYVFGRNVNDKLGHIGYVSFYLAGAVFSGIGHILVPHLLQAFFGLFGIGRVVPSSGPVLGASGAIAAVTGAYLVLFPQTMIVIFYWLYIVIDTVEISALYFIGFQIVFENIIYRVTPNVAYDAHLSGYAFGITAMLVMLGTGLSSSSSYDLLALLKHWRRRRRYREVVAGGYDPFAGRVSKKIEARQVENEHRDEQQLGRVQGLRHEIAERIAQRNMSEASHKYLELMSIDAEQLLPRQHLLDIANELATENRHAAAAAAYEKFIAHYKTYEYIEQVELMLGILYSRYLQQAEPAKKHLEAALAALSDPGQITMCRDELQRLQG
jgi:membrane associated rhomboid family serine protease